MSIICIAKGTATIGMTTRGADGKIISQTPARWEHDPDGGCVALWTMNPETEEQEAPARIYGDWQASEYLGDVLAELKPRRKVNLPDFPAIVRAAMADGMDICVYCQSFGCNECIVNEWKSERSDEECYEWEDVDSCWGFYCSEDELIKEVISEHELQTSVA